MGVCKPIDGMRVNLGSKQLSYAYDVHDISCARNYIQARLRQMLMVGNFPYDIKSDIESTTKDFARGLRLRTSCNRLWLGTSSCELAGKKSKRMTSGLQ